MLEYVCAKLVYITMYFKMKIILNFYDIYNIY